MNDRVSFEGDTIAGGSALSVIGSDSGSDSVGFRGETPASLDTRGNWSNSRSLESTYSHQSPWRCGGVLLASGVRVFHAKCRRVDGGCVPIRALRPRSQGWRGWTDAKVAALEALGARGRADAAMTCGRYAWSLPCAQCGASPGRIVIQAACDGRTCPLCARRDSQARASELERALKLIPGLRDSHAVEVCERLAREAGEHEAVSSRWIERALGWSEEKRPRAIEFAELAARRARRCRQWLKEIARRHTWRVRFVTLTHWYDPSALDSFSPEALRARVVLLFRQWSAVWTDWASVGGLAAYVAHVEISELGHVHLHIVYVGPWAAHRVAARLEGEARAPSYIERLQIAVNPLAGWSDVRAADADVHRELAKYTAKTPTPGAPAWLAGERRTVLSPTIAAAWEVALHGLQVWRHSDLMREAIKRDEPKPFEGWSCRCCDFLLAKTMQECSQVVGATHATTSQTARAALDRERAGLAVPGLRWDGTTGKFAGDRMPVAFPLAITR